MYVSLRIIFWNRKWSAIGKRNQKNTSQKYTTIRMNLHTYLQNRYSKNVYIYLFVCLLLIVGVFFQLDSHFMLISVGNVIFEQQMHDDQKKTTATENEKKDTMANYSFNIEWNESIFMYDFTMAFLQLIIASHYSISNYMWPPSGLIIMNGHVVFSFFV